MTLNIGRVIIVDDPDQVGHGGDGLSIAGWFFGTSFAHASVIRQQLLGLDGNQDEPVVPVMWSLDAGIAGYYRVGTVDVTPVRAVSPRDFGFQYAIGLGRVQGGFAAPLCEVATSVAVRTNAHAVTAPVGYVGMPFASTFRKGAYTNGTAVTNIGQRTSSTGAVTLNRAMPSVGSFMAFRFATAPVDYYDGAATIEQSVGGVWYPVVGDQIGDVSGNLLRIGNGLTRLTFHTDGIISTEIFDGAVWESATSFQLQGSSSQKWSATGGWRVLRNSAEVCVVQTSVKTQNITFDRVVTFRIERGGVLTHIVAEGLYYVQDAFAALNEGIDLRAVTNTAATALTGGIRQTSNDANGHRWVMMSPSAVTKDTTNGRLTIAAPGVPLAAQFGLGWEKNGSAADAGSTAVLVADEYFAALGLRQRVVAR